MDPTTIIVSMLIKAAAPTAERAIADAYQVMRTALIRRYPNLGLAVTELEQHPDSPQARQTLVTQLRRSGADRDHEIVELAADLEYFVNNLGVPIDPASRLARAKRGAGQDAVQVVLSEHVDQVLKARRAHRVEDAELLTGNLAAALPPDVRSGLMGLHERMRTLISHVADRLEAEAYEETLATLAEDRIGMLSRERALAVVGADRALHTSYRALELTVDFFREFNSNLLQRIEQAPDADAEGTMLLGNAIMIYELANYVIGFLRSFTPDGIEHVEELWRETIARIASKREEQRAFAQRLEAQADASPELRENTMLQIQERLDALTEVEREWEKYVQETKAVNGVVEGVRGRIATLEIIRDNAAGQISVLQEIALLRFLKQNTSTINRTIDVLSSFTLPPLSPSRVRNLLVV